MSRRIINSIYCSKCNKNFEVATEDIEWEHIRDAGETEEDSSVHDYIISQTVKCPHCGKENKILIHAKGKKEDQLEAIEVISSEIDFRTC